MRTLHFALLFSMFAGSVHGQTRPLSPEEAVTVLRASHSAVDLTGTQWFVPERSQALVVVIPSSTASGPFDWPEPTPILPLSRQPFVYGRVVFQRRINPRKNEFAQDGATQASAGLYGSLAVSSNTNGPLGSSTPNRARATSHKRSRAMGSSVILPSR